MLRKHYDAQTGADLDLMLAEGRRIGERFENFIGCDHRTVHIVDRGQQNHKLIAANARDGIGFAQTGAGANRNMLEHQIADVMAQRVVDFFETIQIHRNQREALALSPGDENGLL